MSDESQKRSRVPEFYKKMSQYGRPVVAIDKSSLNRYNVSKTVITRAIEQKSIVDLRGYSQYFFHASGEYRRLVEYFSKILTFDYLVVPVPMGQTQSKGSASKNEKAMTTILNYVDNSYVKETGRIIAGCVVKDGAFYGYERELDGMFVLQQLPTEFCRTRFKIDGAFSVEFNFDFFKGFRTEEELKLALESFPVEFGKMYNTYLKDTKLYQWQLLDPVFARAHMLTDEVPFLSPVFVDLIELEDYKVINKQRTEQEVEEVIVQTIPLDENGEFTMELEEIEAMHENARMAMGASTTRKILTTPAKIDALDFKSRVGVAQDDVEKATKMIYSSSGTPMILFASGSTGSSVGLEKSVQTDEAIMFELLDQFERWYDNRFRALVNSKNVEYKMMFPHHSIFNVSALQDKYQGAATYGMPTKLLWMASLGIDQSKMAALLNYENETLGLPDLLIPVVSSHTQSGEETGTDEGGRPESKEPLSEEGQKTRDQKKNDNREKGGS